METTSDPPAGAAPPAPAALGGPGVLVSPDEVARFRRDGFLRVPQVLAAEEVARFRLAAERSLAERSALNPSDRTFAQLVNLWRDDAEMAELTRHPGLAAVAGHLAGVPLRLWHDQLLVKLPHNGAPTEFHQDAPYWPHQGTTTWLSAWVALVDVPIERGCMTFLPGQHHRDDLRAVDLTDAHDLMSVAPDLTYAERVTVPLRAGDATFHHGLTPHTANANATDQARFAHVVIYMDAGTRFDGRPHVVTDPLGLAVGAPFPEEEFPRLA